MKYKQYIRFILNKINSSSLFKTSGIYTISSFLNASIPFLLLPVLTRYLTRADFGAVSMFTSITGLMMPFVGINMEGAIARKYYSQKANISRYVGNCILVSIFSTFIVFAICYLFINKIVEYSGVAKIWVLIAVLYCLCQFLCLVLMTLYQVEEKPIKYGILQVTQSFLNFVLSIILVVAFSLKWNGRLIAMALSTMIVALISLGILFYVKKITFRPNMTYIKHALKFGGGLIPHALGASLIVITNRFFLLRMINIEETGLYSLANQVGSIISFFTISFNNAFVPWLYKNLNEATLEVKKKIVKLTYLYFVLIVFAGFLFYLFIPYFFQLFIGKFFSASLKYTFWIILGFVFQGMYFMVTNYISYSEKTYYQAFVTLLVGLINIPANYLLINEFGATGAAMAFSCSFFLLFIFTWILSSKVYNMPWLIKIKVK